MYMGLLEYPNMNQILQSCMYTTTNFQLHIPYGLCLVWLWGTILVAKLNTWLYITVSICLVTMYIPLSQWLRYYIPTLCSSSKHMNDDVWIWKEHIWYICWLSQLLGHFSNSCMLSPCNSRIPAATQGSCNKLPLLLAYGYGWSLLAADFSPADLNDDMTEVKLHFSWLYWCLHCWEPIKCS